MKKLLTATLSNLTLVTSLLLSSCMSASLSNEHFLTHEGQPQPLQSIENIQSINGEFPQEIYIKTNTQTFNFEYEFLLQDGYIYSKKRGQDSSRWHLFLDTGLASGKKVAEIAADADVLYAFTYDGMLYRNYTNEVTNYTPFEWVDYFGWPTKIQLFQSDLVKDKKVWCVGSSRTDVCYYEDSLGNQHNYGPLGVESILFLSENGNTINYCDPACLSDFSHKLKLPSDKAEVLFMSESASTIFLINCQGKMFTRLADYNVVGSNPMLYRYSYVPEYSQLRGTDTKSNTSTWILPAEDWKEQPPLPSGARITKYLTILQTGRGNDNRQLRIAALNPDGEPGYYFKDINEDTWFFKKVNLTLNSDSFIMIQPIQAAVEDNAPYYGDLWINGKRQNINCAIKSFDFAEGPVIMDINDAAEICFYYSLLWNPFLRYNPGITEESEVYLGTLVTDTDTIEALDINYLTQLFTNTNNVPHMYDMEAYESFIRISIKDKKNTYEFYLTKEPQKVINPYIDRNVIQQNKMLLQRIDNQSKFYDDRKQLFTAEQKLLRNKKNYSSNFQNMITFLRNSIKVTFVDKFSPKVKILTEYSSQIVKTDKEIYKQRYELESKYIKYLSEYEDIIKDLPQFDAAEYLRHMNAEGQEITYFDIPYYPAYVLNQDGEIYLCEYNDTLKKLISDYNSNKKIDRKIRKTRINK